MLAGFISSCCGIYRKDLIVPTPSKFSARAAVIGCKEEGVICIDQISGVTAWYSAVNVCIACCIAAFFAEILAPQLDPALASVSRKIKDLFASTLLRVFANELELSRI